MFTSINPYDNKIIQSYQKQNAEEVCQLIDQSAKVFKEWKNISITERGAVLDTVAALLLQHKKTYATVITIEMGKPIQESIAEIEKCAWLCNYYAENAANFLDEEFITTDASKSSVQFQPLGVILGIMPWNFPFWQIFRFAVPALMSGNSVIVKPAPNVIGCAKLIQQIIREATSYKCVFQILTIDIDQVEEVIKNENIKVVTFTGSESAGKEVAQLASKYIKKSILELGGSNSFIVLDDADMYSAVKVGAIARLLNTGQSCIAAKRFILHEKIADAYIENLKIEFEGFKKSNPLDENTLLGVISREDLIDKLQHQVQDAIDKGAELICGGRFDGNYYAPTILKSVTPDMLIYHEEVFGPVAVVHVVEDDSKALILANDTNFGLGASVFTKSTIRANKFIEGLDDGAVFINSMVKSDPRLPFGGTKHSGYGRELGTYGIKEFVNIKTVYWK
jgi:succinate-semialdehyde dehydrogenase/glutarate-semialdehyde dehydrogenase